MIENTTKPQKTVQNIFNCKFICWYVPSKALTKFYIKMTRVIDHKLQLFALSRLRIMNFPFCARGMREKINRFDPQKLISFLFDFNVWLWPNLPFSLPTHGITIFKGNLQFLLCSFVSFDLLYHYMKCFRIELNLKYF